jgi:peptide/nickel transport system substrate-binding protein
MATAATACSRGARDAPQGPAALLRVGVPGLSPTNPGAGLRQLTQILSVEGLARLGEDGRLEPWLAADWSSTDNGRSFLVHLKPGVRFHDGSALTATSVVDVLPTAMRETFGPIADDVTGVTEVDAHTVAIRFVHPSPFAFEALEAGIRKPGQPPVGTGPFIPVPNSTSELRANADYYAGRPVLREIRVENFPSVRTAWAKMLRNELDMLWEVGPDALSSLEHSANIAVFTFTRRYQYAIALNTESPALRSAQIRRALNMAIDRTKLVAAALNGHGVPSTSPIWPRYWALEQNLRNSNPYNPAESARLLNSEERPRRQRAAVRFSLLIASDAVYERIALELKRQLEDVGIDMDVRAVSQDEQFDAALHGRYDALLMDLVSGPTMLRPYAVWHSKMPGNLGAFGNRAVDLAFDAVRAAETESAYRMAVTNLVRTFADDPPGIFLAWSVRARAISKRFDVQAEEGRDVLSTLRMWKPAGAQQEASRN